MKRNYSAVLSLLLAGGICCTGCAKAGGEATAAEAEEVLAALKGETK